MALKLYILDDDEQYATLLAEVASNIGWEVLAQQDPIAFLQDDILQGSVLVLDLNMPEMDGIEVIRVLAEKKINLLLILVSGFDARVLHSAQQLAEAHHFKVLASLTKPMSIQEFAKTLNSIKPQTKQTQQSALTENSVSATELEQALQQHQLVLYYQPQINMQTGDLHGVEALVRWQHPEYGLIYPNQFIGLAEQSSLIEPLTEEVIRLAVEQSRNWQAEGINISVSINVSAENITSLSLPEQLKKLTDKHAIDPNKITLEITENAVMGDLTSSLDVLNRLRMKGFALSIDDFGTGYSSLSHLYKMPFTELKIDQSFIMQMLEDSEAMVIVKICIMLGQMLGMKLVAEGVETQEVWDELQTLGCDIAQGYLMAKPMPADALVQWIRISK
ncbi:diguanylate cyclase/phosphodiesterase (GGDEF & EAL domains) with PAS/PAC sensor(s) [hydrothermal vent metagenome]|uniref:Diguanylate cyclase/phosphodiesterase (GGDEF & EAL domains) with PAS/PAC sensor(S) n=1 Tax=hydrothermal vent metagenome TaxID=652676 RepID=A0A3B1A5B0_9ZZZZ